MSFFGYFTNLSNILAAIALLIGAYNLLQRREPTLTTDLARGTAAMCMAVVGIVFSILLRDEDVGSLQPWVNTVLHYIMPVVMVLDWLIFPFIYIVYTLVRGAIADFYLYPFLNPAKVGGYGGVALYCLGILVLFILLSWRFMFLGNSLKRHVE